MVARSHQGFYQMVGAKIREWRERRGMTQASLGEEVGLSRTSITNVERGRQAILLHQFVDFASALRVKPSALIPLTTSKPESQLPSEIASLVKRLKPSIKSTIER
jgi:transcriptional regulator with XRE-family HTH domain